VSQANQAFAIKIFSEKLLACIWIGAKFSPISVYFQNNKEAARL